MVERWIRRYVARPQAQIRLICFPHAGGAASAYRTWAQLSPPEVEVLAVQYPGREDRFGEPLAQSMTELAEGSYAALLGELDRPYVLFGHSMGACLAYEVASLIQQSSLLAPRHLIVSARQAPTVTSEFTKHIHDDAALAAELTSLGGTDTEVLENPDFRALVLPIMRADYHIVQNYQPQLRYKNSCPVTVFLGDADPDVSMDDVQAWADITSGPCQVQIFPGGHFYLNSERQNVLSEVIRLSGDNHSAARL